MFIIIPILLIFFFIWFFKKSLKGNAILVKYYIKPQIDEMFSYSTNVHNYFGFSSLIYISLIAEGLTGRRISFDELLEFSLLVLGDNGDTHDNVDMQTTISNIFTEFRKKYTSDHYYALQDIILKEVSIETRAGRKHGHYLWGEGERIRYGIDSVEIYLRDKEMKDFHYYL